MKAIKQFLAVTGSALVIMSCQDSTDDTKRIESDADSKEATEQPAIVIDNSNMATPSNQYVDLKTGKNADLYYDNDKKMTYSAVNNEPVDLYVNVATGDTVYGRGRYIVNNYVIRTEEGTYKLDDAKVKVSKDGIKIKDGDRKLKIEDGEMKIKDGDTKYKADADEEKLKTKDGKTKMEDEDSKMKTDDQKTKIDDGKVKTKDQ
jgi:hypothetical protein